MKTMAIIGMDLTTEQLAPWQSQLQEQGIRPVVEPCRPDLSRLKGTLIAASADPRFEILLVTGGKGHAFQQQVHAAVMGQMYAQLETFPLLAHRVLRNLDANLTESDFLFKWFGLGTRDGRLMLSLPGGLDHCQAIWNELVFPKLDVICDWAR